MRLRLPILACVLFLIILPIFATQVQSSSSVTTLYAHAETTTLPGGNIYYLHKLSPADGPATTLTQSAATTGRKEMGRWIYPLSGIISIPASTWTVTYRAMKSASASQVVAHGDVDILIMRSDNTVRATIGTNVANSPSITLTNAWQTLTGTYNWPGYTVVDQTDYLEVVYYIEVTYKQSSKSVRLLVDDGTLPLADQTKIANVIFTCPNQAPVASFSYSPAYPAIYETVTFDASASYDPDGNIVSYTWDFGDGNVATVTNPTITHIYTTAMSTLNYTVTLTITDNEGSTGSTTQNVPVTNPTILEVSLPAGTYVGPDLDHWLSQCWLLNITGLSETFTVRINNTHASWISHDTHLIIALNDAAHEHLDSLTVDATTIPPTSFIYGTPTPYGYTLTWEEDVYPTWFSDAYVVGDIDPKDYKDVQVSVTFSDTTGLRMHFDAYGSREVPPPSGKGLVTHNAHEKDSTVLFSPPPVVYYYLTVRTDPPGVTPIPGEGWYGEGAIVSLTAPEYVSVSIGVRYRFSYWDVDGIPKPGNPINVAMDADHIATAHYILQYYLTLATDPLGVTSPSGEGWYDADTYASISTDAFVDIGPGSSRYRFDGWTTADMAEITNPSAPSTTVKMDKPKTVTANYVVQYKVTFNQSGVGPDFTGIVVTIDGVGYTVETLPFRLPVSFWWDENTYHTFLFSSPLVVDPSKQYVWISTTGLSTLQGDTLKITESGSVTGNYIAQFIDQITFAQTGVGTDFTGTVVIIDGINYKVEDLPKSFPWDRGSRHAFAFQSPLVVTPNAKQYVWTSTSGLSSSQSGEIIVSTSGFIIGDYKTQYFLNLTTNPPGVVPLIGADWYDANTYATIAAPPTVDIGPSTRYRFDGWTTADMSEIANPSATSTTVKMDKAKTVTANYVVQYYLTVTSPSSSSPYGSPTPTSGWFDAGTRITASVTSPWLGPEGTQYVCTGWIGTGSVPPSGTETTVTFTINEPSSIEWLWKTQYYLTVQPSPPGITTIPGQGWYDSSTRVSLTAPNVAGYNFQSWDVDGVYDSQKTIEALMDGLHTATAHYTKISAPVGGFSVSLTPPAETAPLIGYTMILAIFGAVITLIRRKRK